MDMREDKRKVALIIRQAANARDEPVERCNSSVMTFLPIHDDDNTKHKNRLVLSKVR